ncbi:MAG TPA: universal stress protein [Nitrososphaeraceae archaeon]|nr:universal stress protein [Nitrososphaeraceae archaeon]
MSTNAIDSTKKFSKILVAIDGSEPSMDAADYAILMARIYNSPMTALYVLPEKIRYEYQDKIDSDVPSDASTNTDSLRRIVELPRQEIEENSFRKIKEKCKENNVKVNTEVVSNAKSIVAQVVDYAESNNVDLIVVGTRGRTGFKKLLLGSVASGVVTYAHCPVMVVK